MQIGEQLQQSDGTKFAKKRCYTIAEVTCLCGGGNPKVLDPKSESGEDASGEENIGFANFKSVFSSAKGCLSMAKMLGELQDCLPSQLRLFLLSFAGW